MRSILMIDLFEEHSSSCFGWFLAAQNLSLIVGYPLAGQLSTFFYLVKS